jgi:hypothetical protein
MEIFSTITSPVFSELVILVDAEAVYHLPSEVKLFETLRTMAGIRPFKLVFSLMDPDLGGGETRQKLVGALDSITTRGLLDFLSSPPAIRIAQFWEHAHAPHRYRNL